MGKNPKNINDDQDEEYVPGRQCDGVRSYKFLSEKVRIN